ncbi:Ras domain-containing protein [Rhizoctonia solani AG-1 IA]|uniref:Ras domain-containing protein n=1 Tax=Thanatephorus cucumeris (strain AG1-IA) TaxID=983506 RepID=L8WK85_THACA|nr:Ras domain-containing protein [Rhizoctonia solani AG-1 IA]
MQNLGVKNLRRNERVRSPDLLPSINTQPQIPLWLPWSSSPIFTMVDTRQLQGLSEGDPLGAIDNTAPERPQPSHTPSLPPYSPALGKIRLLTVTYCPSEDAEATSHTALIPWTNDYETALISSKEAFEQYFPPGSSQRRRWLTTRVQTSSGVTWAEFRPVLFSQVVGELGVELRLCEDRPRKSKLDVTVLPIGHERLAAEEESYYQFKIITVGQRSVGKSMSEWSPLLLQYFTKPEEERLETLSSTVGPSMDIANRFMTAHGELVKTVLWDTGRPITLAGCSSLMHILYYSWPRGFSCNDQAVGVFITTIADTESFDKCLEWLTEVRAHVDENAPIMLIGNQVDRTGERTVETNSARAFARKQLAVHEDVL